jgi:8-oxo-dGTP diphosphatase
MNRTVIKVVAAVIQREEKILIGQRSRFDTHPLKWEFPGGKLEPGESPAHGLARELREELGISAHVGHEIARYEHRYPRRASILLMFYSVTDFRGEPHSLVFERIVWEKPDRLPLYDFLDGDVDFVRRLASGEFRSRATGT